MERKVKRAAIVSRSTAADNEETEASKRERESVCVCWLRVSRFNDSKTRTEGGKAQRKTGARLRDYSPVAHSAACRSLYSVRSYLQTRLLVHNDEKMVVRKGNDRSACALPCGISQVRRWLSLGQSEPSTHAHTTMSPPP